MHGKFSISLHLENENLGEIIRDFKTDIYIDALDGCSIDYIKECIISACNSAVNITNDIDLGNILE
ncbi:hypothetical protein D9O40_14305 [Clostridium autoethanogenum]|uniref:Uncharacterized protein n=2 Tax=Clostridium TaxID=1485 RepID=A0A168LQS7_9CLOT|nr:MULTISPECIES: hypothetical protein [Clostridium]OAA83570.1 hypothetical protein WY13_03357 [Clostridium ljungdahlii]RMC97797.1 hypothetical protein D9O40_14305 [Clostridium autoethanogenum]